MPCWVAPAVAAEMWGLSLDEVMELIACGSLDSRSEAEFLFVDVLPDQAEHIAAPPPPTFTVLTHEEIAALSDVYPCESQTFPQGIFMLGVDVKTEADADAAVFEDEETPTFSASDWKQVRAKTARTRRPPAGNSPVALAA